MNELIYVWICLLYLICIFSPSVIGEGLIKLLEAGDNGKVMRITELKGFEYATFEEQPEY